MTLKSIPTVAIKLQLRKVSSLKRTNKQVLPTPLSPMSIILKLHSKSSWLRVCWFKLVLEVVWNKVPLLLFRCIFSFWLFILSLFIFICFCILLQFKLNLKYVVSIWYFIFVYKTDCILFPIMKQSFLFLLLVFELFKRKLILIILLLLFLFFVSCLDYFHYFYINKMKKRTINERGFNLKLKHIFKLILQIKFNQKGNENFKIIESIIDT